MAGNGDNNHVSAKEQWPFDVLDDFDDALSHLLKIPGDSNALNFSGGSSSTTHGAAPPVAGTAIADPSAASTHHNVGALSSPVDQGSLVDCTGCKIPGENVYSNGYVTAKLCVHGAGVKFYHATVDLYHGDPRLTPAHRSFTDFRGRDHHWVMSYLMDYAHQRAAAGLPATTSSDFFDMYSSMVDSIGVGDDRHEAPAPEAENIDEQQLLANVVDGVLPMVEQKDILIVASGPSQQGNNAVNEQEQPEVGPTVRNPYTMQTVTSCYFHLTIADASKELRVSTTVLKGLSKKFSIKHWPYRKIKDIDNQIAKLTNDGNGSAEAMDKIMKLYDFREKDYQRWSLNTDQKPYLVVLFWKK